MSIKTRLAALEKIAKSKGCRIPSETSPPDRAQFKRLDGTFDHHGYRTAADRWSIEVFGKPLEQVAEEIAEAEGF